MFKFTLLTIGFLLSMKLAFPISLLIAFINVDVAFFVYAFIMTYVLFQYGIRLFILTYYFFKKEKKLTISS